MYLSILFLPLLGSVVSGLLGRKIGVTGSHIITCSSLGLASVMAAIAFYEVGICGSPVSIYLTSWIDSELMSISWGFLFEFTSTLFHIWVRIHTTKDSFHTYHYSLSLCLY
jgi:NADH-ubiquinone oxidoreductase chain 5